MIANTNLNTIAISRTDKIGDLVLSIPSIVMVRKIFPTAKIILIVNSYNLPIVKYLDIIDDIITIDQLSEKNLIVTLKKMKLDIFIALYTNGYIGKIAYLSGAKKRIAPLSKIHSYFLYNFGIKQSRSKSIKNEAEYNLDLIKTLDINRFNKEYTIDKKIIYQPKHREYIDNFISKNIGLNKDIIIIAPCTGGSCKNLSLLQYKLLTDTILSMLDNNTKIIIISSSQDKNLLEIFNDSDIVRYINNDDLLNIVALIDSAKLFIGASTGTTHIAGNLRKRVVAIYPAKKTESKTRWGLFGNEQNTLYIVPDEDSDDKNSSSTIFSDISDDKIASYANIILDYYNEK